MISRVPQRCSRYNPTTALGIAFLFVLAGGCDLGKSPEQHFEDARKHCGASEWRACEIELKNVLRSDQENAEALVLLGEAYLGQALVREAGAAFARARELGVDTAAVRLGSARVAVLLQEFDQARQLDPDSFEQSADRAIAHTLLGEALFGLQKSSEAMEAFRQALKLDPLAHDARVGFARVAAHEKRYAVAHRQLDQVLRIEPGHVLALLSKAQLLAQEQKLAEAEAAYRHLLSLEGLRPGVPQHTAALLRLAEVLLRVGKVDQVRPLLATTLEQQPKNHIAKYYVAVAEYELKNLSEAERLAREVLLLAPDSKPATYLLGVITFAHGDYSEANRYLSRLSGDLPADAPGRKMLAVTELRLGQHEKLMATVQPALQSTDDPTWSLLAASAASGMGRYDESQSILETAIENHPDSGSLRVELGLSHLRLGDFDRALAQFATVTENHGNIDDRVLLLSFSTQLRAGRFSEARGTLARLRERHPVGPHVDYLEANLLIATKTNASAIRKLREIIADYPDYAAAHEALTRLQWAAGDRPGAFKTLEDLLAQTPGSQRAMLQMAELHGANREFEQARKWIAKARKIDENSVQPDVFEARVDLAERRPQTARLALRRALEKDPDNIEALALLAQLDAASRRHQDAVRGLRKIAEQRPYDMTVKTMLANEYLAARKFASARQLITELRGLAPSEQRFQVMEFDLELAQGNNAEALAIARRIAAKNDPASTGALLLARYHSRVGEWQEASRYFSHAYEARPTESVLLGYARALIQLGRGGKAIELLKEGSRKHPGNVNLLFQLAQLYQISAMASEAQVTYQEILKIAPKHGPALNNIAWLYMDTDHTTALQYAEEAVRAMDLPEVRDTLAWVLIISDGDLRRAITLLQSAVAERPASQEIRWHYAYALHKSGLNELAIEQLERALSNDTMFESREDAQALLAMLKNT